MSYLRSDLNFEPVINGWYATPLLLAPFSRLLIEGGEQRRILDSFVRNPELHVRASRNPETRGGPFAELLVTDVPAAEELLRSRAPAHRASEKLRGGLEILLLSLAETRGRDLGSVYEQIPAEIQGSLELVYGNSGYAQYRVLEGVMERLPIFFRPEIAPVQEVLVGKWIGDRRPFVLSTPRIGSQRERSTAFTVPFADPRWDRVFAARWDAISEPELAALLDSTEDDVRFLLAERPSDRNSCLEDGKPLLRCFGHASVQFSDSGSSVFVDPLVPADCGQTEARFSWSAVDDFLDAVLLTHAHQDHVSLETLLQLRTRIGVLLVPKGSGEACDPSIGRILKSAGFSEVVEVEPFDSIETDGGFTITVCPFLGEHGDLDISSKVTYNVQSPSGRTAFFAADATNASLRSWELVREALPPIDYLFVGLESEGAPADWLYKSVLIPPLSRDNALSRRLKGLDSAQAVEVVAALNPRRVIIYAMGREEWVNHLTATNYSAQSPQFAELRSLKKMCAQRALGSVIVLDGAVDLVF